MFPIIITDTQSSILDHDSDPFLHRFIGDSADDLKPFLFKWKKL